MRGDDRNVRAHQLGERRDLAGVVHADLEHRVFRARRTARERQRHAPVIVVGGGRGMRLAVGARAPARSASLVPVLPTEPVTAMTLACERARAARARSRRASSTSCTASSGASSANRAPLVARDHGEPGAGLQRAVDEVMAVAIVALDGEERFAFADRAAVDGQAGHVRRQRAGALGAHRRCHGVNGPQRAHATLPCKRRRDRFVIGKRQHAVADDLPGLVALAGDQQHVAAFKVGDRRRGSPRRGRRFRRRRGAAGEDGGADRSGIFAARIVVGDDDAVGILRGNAAHDRPLAGVAVAAGAEHHHQACPAHRAAALSSAFSSASGLCA